MIRQVYQRLGLDRQFTQIVQIKHVIQTVQALTEVLHQNMGMDLGAKYEKIY